MAMQNIWLFVPLVLDIASAFYGCWRQLFLLVIGRYSLESHVLFDAAAPNSSDWVRMDCVVQTWITDTISNALAEAVIEFGTTARASWLTIESQFRSNRKARALQLDAAFRNFKQGDLDITMYYRKVKGMAYALRDLGEPVNDRTLVLNLQRGLNGRLEAIGRHLRRERPFPTFLQAHNDLLLETLPPLAMALTTTFGSARPPTPSCKVEMAD
ncbi:uncharacterized protein [Miscanthus floridulus]|uniref:uncharacterized protein n=1 Tax=Miscanthus floridulus TaxID=154761 RepID=UPI00345A258A